MSDTEDKFETLIDSLIEKTNAGEVDWSLSFQNKPECNFGKFILRLDESETAEGEPLEILYLLNSMEEVIDKVTDADLSHGYWTRMGKLRKAASRQARGINSAIDSILSKLNQEGDDDI